VAITLAKQRLMTASFDYYALRYPHEGLGGGFDYETVPHITLKSIANNADIDTIYDEDHPKIVAALANLNAALKGHELRLESPQGGRNGEWIDFAAPDDATFTLPTGQTRTIRETVEGQTAIRDETSELRMPPLRRPITLEDTAKTAVFLASDLASGLTAQIVTVCAGQFPTHV
jgi:hypothetical protein